MGRSLPKIEAGLLHLSSDSLQGLLLTLFVKLIQKGDKQPITITELCEMTGEKPGRVVGALVDLDTLSILRSPNDTGWFGVEAFTLGSLSIKTLPYVEPEDPDGQGKLDLGPPPTRYESLREQKIVGSVVYEIVVSPVYQADGSDGLLKADFRITARDVGSTLDPIEKVVESCNTIHEAFDWWDQWLQAYDPASESENASVDESAPLSADVSASFELSDGTPVTVSGSLARRGVYRLTFVGELDPSGEWSKEVKKTLWGLDFAEWAKGIAEIRRAEFVRTSK